jgi:protein-arginine deiminase
MHRSLLPWLAALAAGCNGPPPPVVDLVVDSNRSGLLEPGETSEDEGEDTWDAKHGAVFLANLDDDDKDGRADADDQVVNGKADIDDLSPIALRAWPLASLKATGVLSMDDTAAQHVRVFRVSGPADDPASYQAVSDPRSIALTQAELVAGVQLAIEGRHFLTSTQTGAWDGYVKLSLAVTDPEVKEPAHKMLLADAVKLRVAPVLFQYNTAPSEEIFHTDASQYTQTLSEGIAPAAAAAQKPVTALDLQGLDLEVDVWAQDFFDIAYTSKPGPGGKPIGMKVAIRSAQPDRSAGEVTRKRFFGPGWAVVEIADADQNGRGDHSYSMNSFGNWDVIPPYEKGTEKYPLGRNLWGATGSASTSPDAVFADFVRAQAVQPHFTIDTSWLGVGHVDEYTSWVKAPNKRGWVMLLASPRNARQMLMSQAAAGHGQKRMFETKTMWDWQGRREVPAAIAVDAVLADPDLMAAGQRYQTKIDTEGKKLKDEIGLADDEVILMPFMMESLFGGAAAFQPGTVNLLYFDGHVVIADPFGPEIDGADPFKEDLKTRLGAIGLSVHFADDWDTFHMGGGEVHCGTNASRDMKVAWWESGR